MNMQPVTAGKKKNLRISGNRVLSRAEVAEMLETSPGRSEDVSRQREEKLIRRAAEEWGRTKPDIA